MAVTALRLGVVDDHPPILHGVVAGLVDTLAIPVSPTAATTVAGLLATGADLDIVLLDIQLADGPVPEHDVRALVERGWPVLLYTQETSQVVVAQCFRAGAIGIVDKHEDFEVLARAIEVVLAGEPYLSRAWAGAIEDTVEDDGPRLTPRESEALRLYAAGLPLKSVATRMHVSPETAKEYLLRVRRRYADAGRPAQTKTELYIRAVEDGILPPPEPMPTPS